MKVLMINTFHHPRGGDATYTLSLSRLLEGAGHTVVPLAMRHPDNDPSPWEHRFVSWVNMRGGQSAGARLRLASRMFWSREASRACAALVAETRPDIAHLQHIHRHLTPSVLGPLREAGVPIVWTVHDYELICPEGHLFVHGQPCARCKGHRYWQAVEHRCKWGLRGPSLAAAVEKALHAWMGVWRQVDRFLCPSRFLADTLVDFGVPAERVHHQPNFVQIPDAIPERPGAGWLFAGRLTDEKGVDIAIQAARHLPAERLDICGTGPLEGQLRRAAADLPLVAFHGHLPPHHLAMRIANAEVIVVPSKWHENFPYAVLEAQARGKAVVASRVGGIPEQIRHDRDGLLVPPGDPGALAAAVRRLLDDPGRARRLGRAGRERVRQELGPERHLHAIEDHYRKAQIERRARRAG